MKKILIVDDRADTIELLEMTLKRGDFEVLHAQNGETALRMVATEKPDLIIMDIVMPGEIDGLEATRIIMKNPDTNHCKIIMISGKGRETGREESLKAGALDYFNKPFSPLKLIRRVEELLGD